MCAFGLCDWSRHAGIWVSDVFVTSTSNTEQQLSLPWLWLKTEEFAAKKFGIVCVTVIKAM